MKRHSMLIIKNTVINVPEIEETVTAFGFTVGYGSKSGSSVTLEGCTLIGGNELIVGVRADYSKTVVSQTNTKICDRASLTENDKANWSDMQKAVYSAENSAS